jgi:hypothetical protein
MKNEAFCRAMNSLLHPLSIGAVLLLLLNDHVLRRFWPSWWSGKLGDLAWLVLVPLVLAAIFAWLIPSKLLHHEKAVGALAFALTGLGFTLSKTVPAVHDATVHLFELLTGWQASLLLDSTDLLALPALLVGWSLWRRGRAQSLVLRRRGWAVLSLAVLTVVADAAAPDYGINCLIEQGSKLVAPSLYHQTFVSEDGGLTWQEESSLRELASKCETHGQPWQISSTTDERIRYRFTPGESIEKSEDGGQTRKREVALAGQEARLAYYVKARVGAWNKPGPLDALVHRPTGNMVVAMGYDGVLVRTANDQWRWVPVGSYHREEVNRLDRIWSLLYGEFWLAVALFLLVMGTLGLHVSKRRIVYILFAVLSWCSWGAAVLISPALSSGYGEAFLLFIPLSAFFSLAWGLDGAWQLYRLSPRALIRAAVPAVIGTLLFPLPYVLWSQGTIPHYQTALILAGLLAATTLFAGDMYLRRFFKTISATAMPLGMATSGDAGAARDPH